MAACVIVVAAIAGGLALHARGLRQDLIRADPDSLGSNRRLMTYALAQGRPVYAERCAGCHGTAGQGDRSLGVPDLTDSDWLYGSGQIAEIERVVLYGIRAHNPKGWDLAAMPAYARPVPYPREPAIAPLTPQDITDIVSFLFSIEHRPANPAEAERGRQIYGTRGACWDCHGADAAGDTSIGAPNLRDNLWLYGGGSRAALSLSLTQGRQGVCPAFSRSLDPLQVRAVAATVYAMAHGPAARP